VAAVYYLSSLRTLANISRNTSVTYNKMVNSAVQNIPVKSVAAVYYLSYFQTLPNVSRNTSVTYNDVTIEG